MKRNQFLVIPLITILLFLQGAIAISCEDKRCALEISEAIAIADSIVSGGTTRPTDLNLTTAKKYSTPWNEIVPRDSTSTTHHALQSKLENKTYWLVYYKSRTSELGGDIAVFLDAQTKEVIHVYRGK